MSKRGKVPRVVHSLPASVQLVTATSCRLFIGFCFLVCKNVQEERRERERKIGGTERHVRKENCNWPTLLLWWNRFAEIKACNAACKLYIYKRVV